MTYVDLVDFAMMSFESRRAKRPVEINLDAYSFRQFVREASELAQMVVNPNVETCVYKATFIRNMPLYDSFFIEVR